MGATETFRAKNTVIDLTTILRKTCDDKSLILFESIAISNGDGYIPLKEMNLTVKQYYSRISALTNAGLIKRKKGKYSLTILGKIVRESYATIGQALNTYWKLNALEEIESSIDGLPRVELLKLVDSLIDNHKIKDIITKMLESKRNDVLPPDPQVQRNKGLLEARNLASS